MIVASVPAPGGRGAPPGAAAHPPGRGRTRQGLSPSRGTSPAATHHRSLSPCASESRSSQRLFLAVLQGGVPARHPRGRRLQPGFVPVPGNAFVRQAERLPWGGAALFPGRDGWAVTYFNRIPGCCHEDACDRGVEGAWGVTPRFGEWKWGKQGFPQHLPTRTHRFASTNISGTCSLPRQKRRNPPTLAQLGDLDDSPRGASRLQAAQPPRQRGLPQDAKATGAVLPTLPKTKGAGSGTQLLPRRRCRVVGINHMNWKSTLEMAPQRGDGGVIQLEVGLTRGVLSTGGKGNPLRVPGAPLLPRGCGGDPWSGLHKQELILRKQKANQTCSPNTAPKATRSTKQCLEIERGAELFRSLGLSRWHTATTFCNPFPAKQGRDLIEQTGSLLQRSFRPIPKISLETGQVQLGQKRAGGRQAAGSSSGAGGCAACPRPRAGGFVPPGKSRQQGENGPAVASSKHRCLHAATKDLAR